MDTDPDDRRGASHHRDVAPAEMATLLRAVLGLDPHRPLPEERAADLRRPVPRDDPRRRSRAAARWFDKKWGREKKRQKWVKAHAMIGTANNVITSIVVTDGDSNDCPEFVGLLDRTEGRFSMNEVSGDKAYLSNANLTAIEEAGAVPYIPFRSNSTATGNQGGKGSEAWRKMWLTYQLQREEFLDHYHKRSNVEATFSAMKRKFGASVRSKKFIAQINEVFAKVLCYNLIIVGRSICELGISPPFGFAYSPEAGNPLVT